MKLYIVYQPLALLSGLTGISLISFLVENGLIILRRFKKQDNLDYLTPGKMGSEYARFWVVVISGVSTIIDFGLIAISAKNFGHYFIIAIPAMATLSAYLFYRLSQLGQLKTSNKFLFSASIVGILVLMTPWAFEIVSNEFPSPYFIKRFFTQDISIHQPNELESYILNHSRPDQSILVWGLRPDLNFTTHRRSPSRFVFLLHLFSPTSKGTNGFDEFLDDVYSDPPAVIAVDMTSGTLPFFGAEGDGRCPNCTLDEKAGMEALNQFVEINYQLDRQVYDWVFYLKK